MEFVYEMPESMLKTPALSGSVERFEYDTFTYDENNSLPLKKGAWVYLPYGYSKNFFVIPGGVHDMKAWQLHLYHALQIFFEI